MAKAESRSKTQNARNGSHGKKMAIGLIAGVALVGWMVVLAGRGGSGTDVAARPAFASAALATDVQEVASLFWCSCGSCQEPELAACSCPTAVEAKQLIDRELRQGRPRE